MSEEDCFIIEAAEQHGAKTDDKRVLFSVENFIAFVKVVREQGRKDVRGDSWA